ncbi:winged helix-turn-helix domain-containing protein [Halobacteriovorax sp.]|uniref:response regulator transcription factor n=1 Tax=Halobacteriovorax sp. TaxID=2020862 RepID=UPI0035646050
MRANIIYFDEKIENHIKIQKAISDKFKATYYNDRDLLIKTLSKNQNVDLILIDDYAEKGNFFEFLNDLLIVIDKLQVGVILLSAEDNVENRVKSFDYGIDDFITRPVSTAELNARLENKVKKYRKPSALELKVGNLILNISDQKAYIDGEDKLLTPIEFKVLLTLVRSPNRLHSKDSLINSLWPGGAYGKSKSIDTHICNLRKKINTFNFSIKATKGRGISLIKERPVISV